MSTRAHDAGRENRWICEWYGRRVMALLLVCALAAPAIGGCTSVRTIDPATVPTGAAFRNIDVGDTITLHLRDGRSLKIVVDRIEVDALVSMEGVRYPRSDIRQLQRRSLDGWKTGLLVAGAVLGAYVVAGLAIVSSGSPVW